MKIEWETRDKSNRKRNDKGITKWINQQRKSNEKWKIKWIVKHVGNNREVYQRKKSNVMMFKKTKKKKRERDKRTKIKWTIEIMETLEMEWIKKQGRMWIEKMLSMIEW